MGAPGFDAMDLGDAVHAMLSPSGRLMQRNPDPYIHHFPDGNATLARAIVRRLLPEALPGNSIEDLLQAQADYSRLDRAESQVHIRLDAPCVRVRNVREAVELYYVNNGRLFKAYAGQAILACWHRVIPLLTDELRRSRRKRWMISTRFR